MDNLKISKHTDAVMFSVRIDRALLNAYDDLALKTGHSRNKLIALALEYAQKSSWWRAKSRPRPPPGPDGLFGAFSVPAPPGAACRARAAERRGGGAPAGAPHKKQNGTAGQMAPAVPFCFSRSALRPPGAGKFSAAFHAT